jgi:hypothetical protein
MSRSYEKARKRESEVIVDDGNRVMVVVLYLCTDMRPDRVFSDGLNTLAMLPESD